VGEQTKLERSLSIYLKYGTLITPLGTGMEEHYSALSQNKTGISLQREKGFEEVDLFLSTIPELKENKYDTLLNKACEKLSTVYSKVLLNSPTTGIILSTTKANLDDISNDSFGSSRQIIKEHFQNPNETVIISNACISGVLAINLAADYLEIGKFENVVVIGIDVLNEFVVNGFQSLRALSPEPCTPFDEARKGVTLGEACAILLVTKEKGKDFAVEYLGGSSSNDANHISGPSRTGEGLVRSVNRTLERSKVNKADIDFISAHGTATLYNDEMEALGFNRLELQNVPVNSFKGNFGHTLGAAGVVEVATSMLSMEKNVLFASVGFNILGTTQSINVLKENKPSEVNVVLKTASGFGGGNASLIMKKVQ
jgi:3-oxoacyl-[acyl-carrier-protein] synthase-1